MTALLLVEVRRILARRLVRAFVALAVLGALTGGTITFFKSHKLDEARISANDQAVQAERAREVADCVASIPQDAIPPGLTPEEFCDQIVGTPSLPDPAFHLTNVQSVFIATNAILIVILLALAASLIGAEWHAGTVATQLTWEPRRTRVLVAKVAAIALFAFVALLVLQAVVAAALVPAAAFHGTTAGTTRHWLHTVAGTELRAATVAALAGAVGFAVASIFRNTAAAAGGMFAYMGVLEPILRAVRPRWQPWFLFDNVVSFITGRAQLLAGSAEVGSSSAPGSGLVFAPLPRPHSPGTAGLLIAAYATGLLLIALAVFRRRDVT
jgi:ABC-2 type transport system permease protein